MTLALPAAAQCPLTWSAASTNGQMQTAVTMANGDTIVGGTFVDIDGVPISYLARNDGSNWSTVGGAINGPVWELGLLANGDLCAIGGFTIVGGVAAAGAAIWNGSSWSAHPGAPVPPGEHYCVLPNGNLATGRLTSSGPTTSAVQIDLWDGASWQQIGTSIGSSNSTPNATFDDLAALPTGELVAVGTWLRMAPLGNIQAFNELTVWNGQTWDHWHDDPDPVSFAITGRGDGVLVTDNSVQLWSQGTWTAAPAFLFGARCATQLPDGDLVIGGTFGTGWPMLPPPFGCVRWDRSARTVTSLGIEGNPPSTTFGARVNQLVSLDKAGMVAVFGQFAQAGGVPASDRAWLSSSCPAAVSSTPTACVGPAGVMTLTAERWPWVGATLVSKCTGFSSSSLAVNVLGFATASTPLTTLPQGLPGCDLLATADVLDLSLPTAGQAGLSLDLPGSAAIAGATIHLQTLQLGFGAGGVWNTLSGSNRLDLTIGAF